MKREQILERIRTFNNLPSFPSVVADVRDELEGPDPAPRRIAHLIERDAGLTARIVALASKSAYGQVPPSSLLQAVNRIGNRMLDEVVLTTAMMECFSRMRGFDQHRYWAHCVAVGLTARVVAERVPAEHADALRQVYLGGLLHDLGAIVVGHRVPEMAKAVRERVAESGEPAYLVEQELFALDHAEIGGLVGERIGLPEACTVAARWHHDPWMAPEPSRIIAQVVHIADFVCCNQGYGRPGDGFHTRFDTGAWAVTGYSIDDVPEIIERVRQLALETERYLPAAA